MKVIAFGAFDPLHPGHVFWLGQAKALGDWLIVVVARDEAIRARKGRIHFQGEEERLSAVAALPMVDEALLGNKGAAQYTLLSEIDFDVVALGYDQEPASGVVRAELDARGKQAVKIVRLPALRPTVYKSTAIRQQQGF
ncbi:MAG: FAD synthase [Candidatus Andersenbacteria bacterium]|nr:FAD synthase [Candidatus Andersenbacteria bacterium]